MRSREILVIITTCFLMVISCIDEITLDVDSDQQFVIVNGLISDAPGEYSVTINNSPIIGVGNDNILIPIPGATVLLLADGNVIGEFVQVSEEEAVYTIQFDGAIPNVEYSIEVTLPNSEKIVSLPQTTPETNVEIDTLDFDIVQVEIINESGNVAKRDNVELYLSSPRIQERAFLRWRLTGEYEIVEKYFGLLNPRHCYVKENIDLNNVDVADTEDFLDGAIISKPLIQRSLDSRFNIVYLFNVFQYSLNQEEYLYWSRIDQLIDVEGTLFDPPPGVLNGNMKNVTSPDNRVQGYFSVVRQSFKRQFVDVTKRGYFADTDCESRPNANNPEKCVDCTTLSRSTLEKPEYWIF